MANHFGVFLALVFKGCVAACDVFSFALYANGLCIFLYNLNSDMCFILDFSLCVTIYNSECVSAVNDAILIL